MTSHDDQNFSDQPERSSRWSQYVNDARAGRTSDRMSVTSAREELERQSRTHSSNRGQGSWDTMSQSEARARALAAKSLEDYDYMAPFRSGRDGEGTRGQGSFARNSQGTTRRFSRDEETPAANERRNVSQYSATGDAGETYRPASGARSFDTYGSGSVSNDRYQHEMSRAARYERDRARSAQRAAQTAAGSTRTSTPEARTSYSPFATSEGYVTDAAHQPAYSNSVGSSERRSSSFRNHEGSARDFYRSETTQAQRSYEEPATTAAGDVFEERSYDAFRNADNYRGNARPSARRSTRRDEGAETRRSRRSFAEENEAEEPRIRRSSRRRADRRDDGVQPYVPEEDAPNEGGILGIASNVAGAVAGVGSAAGEALGGVVGRFVPMGIPGSGPKDSGPFGDLRKKAIMVLVAIVLVCAAVFAFQNWNNNRPVKITLNEEQITVEGTDRTINGMLDSGTAKADAGDYVAVDDSVITAGEGYRATVKINGEKTEDLDTRVNDGDEIEVTDGKNICEPYTDSDEKKIGYDTVIQGSGPAHVYTSTGKKGIEATRTGNESGISVSKVTKEPVNTVMQKYHVDTKGEKVIALTFDDGPWAGTTEQILDTLKENDAQATFFTIGKQIPNYEDLVKRMKDEGHQICTHTYDHAEGSGKGVNITYMSKEEQREEIEKGMKAISDVTGEDCSTVIRCPGGNLDEATAENLKDLISAEMGWSLDTQDWRKPGADSIYNVLMSAEGGSIILMHDGGGDRTQTAAAVKRALPKLAEKGYKFVTIDYLLEHYPYEEGQS